MNKENHTMLVSLLKIKKLHVAELANKLEEVKEDKHLHSIYSSLVFIMHTEVIILSRIIGEEEPT